MSASRPHPSPPGSRRRRTLRPVLAGLLAASLGIAALGAAPAAAAAPAAPTSLSAQQQSPQAQARSEVGTQTDARGPAPAAATEAQPAAASPDSGLRGDYYRISNTDTWELEPQNLAITVVDQAIDIDNMVPIYRSLTGRTDNVGVRWTGTVTAPATGEYTFSAIGDNGFRLWVGAGAYSGAAADQLIDFWVNQWDIEQTATRTVRLEAGVPVPIRFDLFQAIGGANIHLSWQSANAGVAKQVVPASAFRLPDGWRPYGASAEVGADGSTAVITFADGTVGGLDGLADHLTVSVDGKSYPIAELAAGPQDGQLTITLGAPVVAGANVRIAYDGKGSLTSGGRPAPAFNLMAKNGSTHRLTTPWADDVDADRPLPEYPRPQLTRRQWQNLNGTWDFVPLASADAPLPTNWTGAAKVVVPYPIESLLSKVNKHYDNFAYHRSFVVPRGWRAGDQRVLLNFGAVDNVTAVLVNGKPVGSHTGGYDSFSFDITDALVGGPNELVVRVTDTTGDTPKGKQSRNPSGIFYTPASGIWQTAWLEPVPAASIDSLKLTPKLSDSDDAVVVKAESATADANATVTVTASDGNSRDVATVTGKANTDVVLPIKNAKRWTPDSPNLYNLRVVLSSTKDGATSTDTVGSYVGLRSIDVRKINGTNRIVLNGKQTFLLSTLDQGYWPDGVYTAPTDQALAWDIQQTKNLGFNTIRKHIKVEPARWYYYADRIGMMVWQDMPSAFTSRNAESTSKRVTDQWESELRTMIDQHSMFSSIIGWIPFNEGWSEWNLDDTARVGRNIKQQDPSRLLNVHSGMNCCQSLGDSKVGDIIDWHQYTGPAAPSPDATRAAIDGEHGGFSLSVAGHIWPGGSVNPYGEVGSSKELTDAYVGNTAKLIGLAREKLSGSVYTQLTDLEGEVNGFYTYDRRVSKMDEKRVREINLALIAAGSGAPAPAGQRAPVAGWNFDQLSGEQSPGIGATPPAKLAGGAALTRGKSGSALRLDGRDDQATATPVALDTTGNYSVAAWVRADTLPGNTYATAVATEAYDGRSPFFLQYSGPARGWAFSIPDGPRAIAPGPVSTGRWYHLVGVRDAVAGTLTLYVDGVKAASATAFGTSASTGAVTFGRAQWDSDPVDFLAGAVDTVRLYNRALSAPEVAALAG
ncbi:LamG-like jellyroll fold domain-containing protein [Nakamurella aerolata]|uniref:Glycoside hydrolase family 2 n=1 Tax=Nakamurella aerolata TaxID=1656892 RepID=A0A849A8L1_9ACTN|nr:LamG-like jellyroll fold domain-containing protein [Nakamurella aerolata]NNG34810.1 glycoside hydrolase family 2 [Nakamurella aerolata]